MDCDWLISVHHGGVFGRLHPGASGISGLLLLVVLIVTSFSDLRWRVIKNQATYPAIVAGLILNISVSLLPWRLSTSDCVSVILGGIGISQSALGGVLCFAGMCIQFMVFGTGAGDVKLVTVVGVYLGWYSGLEIWLCAMILSSIFAIFLVVYRFGLAGVLTFVLLNLSQRCQPVTTPSTDAEGTIGAQLKKRLPLAPFFFLSCGIVMAVTVLLPGETFITCMLRLI